VQVDLHFYFDPVCPFAWMTSKWVRIVAAQRDYKVDWRFISLRILNAHIDYDSHFPPEYEAGHTAGLRLLRVAARTRASTAAKPSHLSMRRSAPGCSTHRARSTRPRAPIKAPVACSSRCCAKPGCLSNSPMRWTTPPTTTRFAPKPRRRCR
jgi:hypothetical protein